MNKSKVSYLVLSDIHLGNPRTKTEYIIDNLLKYFKVNNSLFKKLDVIFLAGDIYDKLLSPSAKEFILVNEWLSLVVLYCNKNNIKLRILEGTPSHDWKQVSVFSKTIEALNVPIDYKYIDTLSIEFMDDLGISVLYVPDEWKHTGKETLQDVDKLLKSHNITQVDIAIMHGQFHYQIPMIELESSHDEDEYLSRVRYYINIGHIHTSSVNRRILAQGSFDRISHNEEEAKGGMVMNIYHTGDMDFLFIKNDNAYPYITFNFTKETPEDIIKILNKKLPKLTLGSKVRLKVDQIETSSLIKSIQAKYRDMEFTISKMKERPKEVIVNKRKVIEPFEIKVTNIETLLFKELTKHNLTEEETLLARQELLSFI